MRSLRWIRDVGCSDTRNCHFRFAAQIKNFASCSYDENRLIAYQNRAPDKFYYVVNGQSKPICTHFNLRSMC